jgi:hypothetical protein
MGYKPAVLALADAMVKFTVLLAPVRLLACGESAQSDSSVKQEPTEVTQKAFA